MTDEEKKVRQRGYVRKAHRKRRDALKEKGICVDCGKNPSGEGHVLCAKCRQERLDREHIRQTRLAVHGLPPNPQDSSDDALRSEIMSGQTIESIELRVRGAKIGEYPKSSSSITANVVLLTDGESGKLLLAYCMRPGEYAKPETEGNKLVIKVDE